MTTLGDTGQVQATRQPAQGYRQELQRLAGVELSEWEALRALEYAARATRPITEAVCPAAWLLEEEEHGGLTVIVRVVRWRRLAIVVAARASDGAPLLGAEWTRAAQEQLAVGLPPEVPASALQAVVAAYAGPVDVGIQPESWRARLSPDLLDVSLMVQRVDPQETPLIVSAEARPLRSGGRGRRSR